MYADSAVCRRSRGNFRDIKHEQTSVLNQLHIGNQHKRFVARCLNQVKIAVTTKARKGKAHNAMECTCILAWQKFWTTFPLDWIKNHKVGTKKTIVI